MRRASDCCITDCGWRGIPYGRRCSCNWSSRATCRCSRPGLGGFLRATVSGMEVFHRNHGQASPGRPDGRKRLLGSPVSWGAYWLHLGVQPRAAAGNSPRKESRFSIATTCAKPNKQAGRSGSIPRWTLLAAGSSENPPGPDESFGGLGWPRWPRIESRLADANG